MITEAIEKLIQKVDLEENEIAEVVDGMMEGRLTHSQIGAFLIALKMKGESTSEITGAAKVMLDKAQKIDHPFDNAVDMCGTGGDGNGTFNVSTTASFVVAGAGIPVAKHGNRSVSSPVGSADVLEELGVDINLDPSEAEKCFREIGLVFLFAPVYHPAMKNVAQPRKEIGVRTIFNILGPIVNPAGVKNQVMGVYGESLIEPIAKVMRNLGSSHSLVVHGSNGMDEMSVTGKTAVAELKDGIVKRYDIDPKEFGFKKRELSEILGGNSNKANAEIILSILSGQEKEAKRDITLLNAAAGIFVSGETDEFKEAVDIAAESIDSGKALNKLNELRKYTSAL